jgi:hypothetical protein
LLQCKKIAFFLRETFLLCCWRHLVSICVVWSEISRDRLPVAGTEKLAVCPLKLQRAVRCRHNSVPKPLYDVRRRQVSAAVRGFSVKNVSVPTQTVRYYKGSVAARVRCGQYSL